MQTHDIKRPAQPQFMAVPSIDYDQADHVFSYQLSFPRNIRAEVRVYGKDLRKQDITRLQKEVGDLAGAFDEETTADGKLTEAEVTFLEPNQ